MLPLHVQRLIFFLLTVSWRGFLEYALALEPTIILYAIIFIPVAMGISFIII